MLGKPGERLSPTSSCRASSFRLQGLGCGGKHWPVTLYFSWELEGILNRELSAENQMVCVHTNPTKQHSKVTMRMPYSPPLPLGWYYFKIHLAIWKAIWILSLDGGLAGFLDSLQTPSLGLLAVSPYYLRKLEQLCCAVIRKQGNCWRQINDFPVRKGRLPTIGPLCGHYRNRRNVVLLIVDLAGGLVLWHQIESEKRFLNSVGSFQYLHVKHQLTSLWALHLLLSCYLG